MWMIRKKFPAIALTVSALLSGCATITPVSGNFPKIAPEQAQSGRDDGKIVRWGGELIETQPEEHQTCFTVLGEPLRHNGQPKSEKGEAHTGRFLACTPGFYDPMVYSSGRNITFVGRVVGVVHHKIGQFNYLYPKLEAGAVYLWPLRPIKPPVQEQFYMGVGFGNYPGWWYGPGWGFWPYW